MKFAKLFEVKDVQILVFKSDDEDDNPVLRIMTELNEVSMTATPTYKSYEVRDQTFEDCDQKMAEQFYNMFKSFTEE